MIRLKEELERRGHRFHTLDVYKNGEVDYVILQDLSEWYIGVSYSPLVLAKYVLKRKWINDNMLRMIRETSKENRLLIIQEPSVVNPYSYYKHSHGYFKKILTWDDKMVDNDLYYKFFYPQPLPSKKYEVPYREKKFLTMICGNKMSNHPLELYSKRKEAIEYLEKTKCEFDLYGFGWDKSINPSYMGKIEHKLDVLSKYKFSICYENMQGVNGYITEKIFDCFFAGTIPVYWGADNICDYIPQGAFVDKREYKKMEDLIEKLHSITYEEYLDYRKCAVDFLKSEKFNKFFSVDAYVKNIVNMVENNNEY